jgi:cellulose synthase/poly-beta-1,6-N-acetylglucosamine synthase-like glycosyltransferase
LPPLALHEVPADDTDGVEQPGLMRRIRDALQSDRSSMLPTHRRGDLVKTLSRLLVMIPAHNESQSIRDCLGGLADQLIDFRKDGIEIYAVVVADNCNDNTEEMAVQAGRDLGLKLTVFRTQGNVERKVGAMNAVWAYIYGNQLDKELHDIEPTEDQVSFRKSIKAVLGMDADSRLAPGALKTMWDELISAPDIGSVSALYTMRFPISKRIISKDDPHYEQKVASGKYGGPVARWWVSMQKQDMASWLLSLIHRGGSTYVAGGQASLYRPQALADVVNKFKTLGPWDPSTQVEDMKLTWNMQSLGWKTLVSKTARCYVDAMRSYHTLVTQREKWDGGLVGLLTSRKGQAKSPHIGFLWRQQAKMAMDAITRALFFSLLAVALMTNQYHWNWLWLTPPVVASLLNMRLALRVPQHRSIDILLAATLVSPEIYLMVRLIVWVKVWTKRLSVQIEDGWEKQYAAQRGETTAKIKYGIFLCLIVGGLGAWLAIHFRYFLASAGVQASTRFDVRVGFVVLSVLALVQTLAMLRQHMLLRAADHA